MGHKPDSVWSDFGFNILYKHEPYGLVFILYTISDQVDVGLCIIKIESTKYWKFLYPRLNNLFQKKFETTSSNEAGRIMKINNLSVVLPKF